jgi:subtilisin family serine protease
MPTALSIITMPDCLKGRWSSGYHWRAASLFPPILLWFLSLFMLVPAWPVQGEEKLIRLRNELITTQKQPQAGLHARREDRVVSGVFLVQFTGPFQEEWGKTVQEMGLELLRFVPEDAFVARGEAVQLSRLREQPFIHWVGPYRPEYKLHQILQERMAGMPPEPQTVSILLAPNVTPAEVAQARRLLQRVQRHSPSRFGTVIEGTAGAAQLAALSRLHSVLWVEPTPQPRLFDEISSKIVGGEDGAPGGRSYVNELGFDGSGVVVAVADAGLDGGTADSLHPDLEGRVDAFFHYGNINSAADEHGHGSHVTGIIAGDGATGETDESGALYGMGVAPGARIVAQRIFDGAGRYTLLDNDFRRLTRDAVRAGADIGSNSWGDDTHGRYDIFAAEFDALVRDADDETPGDQQYILEFSAGNSGPGRQTIGTPAVAKNVIATGASQNNRFEFFIYTEGQEAMADFSSRGPAEDGRIKPDVVAPGTWIASLQSPSAPDFNAWFPISQYYQYQGGTSQSGPHVSGAAAVFVQYYRENHGVTPSPALVKAALINSAVDMEDSFGTEPTPNFAEGWGRVDLTELIGSSKRYEFLDQSVLLTTGEVHEQRVVVASSDAPFKVTLVYTDVPGLPAAIPALVNDLDLEVIGPDGGLYRGNQFDLGESVPDVSATDRINNVEAVHLWEPLAGEYVIRVRARNVAEDARRDTPQVDQDFALVVSGDLPLPGVGVVVLDRKAYTAPGVINIRVIDFDLDDSSPVEVLVRSSSESGGETVSLQPLNRGGVFGGSISTDSGTPAPDGVLQIRHGDLIEVIYEDAAPPATRTATAEADLLPPVISNVAVTNRFGRMVVSWSTDEPATSRVRYGLSADLDLTASSALFRTEHEIALPNLEEEETYFLLVESTDPAGNTGVNDNQGSLFSFVSQPAATILLVNAFLDDFGFEPDDIGVYTDALDATGLSYEIWDTLEQGSPTEADLRPFRVVVWRVAEFDVQTVLLPAEQSAISDYLEGGGGFFMASMEVLSRIGDVPFRTNVLQVLDFEEDAGVPWVVGRESDPISGGMELYLDYSYFPDFFELIGGADFSDHITPSTNAVPIFYDFDTGRPAGLRYPRTGEDSSGRVVFLSFPFPAVSDFWGPPHDSKTLMRRIISFLAPGVGGLGTVALDSYAYTIPSLAAIEVADSDLAGQEEITVQVSSDTTPAGRQIVLQETVRRGLFRGFVTLVQEGAQASPETLPVTHGDSIRVEYWDESNQSLAVATAQVDIIPPEISGVEVEPDYESAVVEWFTTKPSDALVQFGESPILTRTAYRAALSHEHELLLVGLLPDRQYYFQVVSRDAAGNIDIDDNGGELYTFRTLKPISPPWFDDLESDTANWAVLDGFFDFGFSPARWELGIPDNGMETEAFSPVNAWGSNLRGWVIDFADTTLISPAFELSGGNEATLSFWHSYDFWPRSEFDIWEVGELYVFTDGGRNQTLLRQYTDFSFGWEEEDVDLTPWLGKVVRIGWYYGQFSFEDLPRPGWLLDDISITVTNVVRGTISVTNNISQARFTITGPVTETAEGFSHTIPRAPLGEYTVTFEPVEFYLAPEPQTQVLDSITTLSFTGEYTFPDSNNNGISDEWELRHFGEVSPARTSLTDSDGDGMTDYQEFMAGTDPNDPDSVLSFFKPEMLPNGAVRLRWNASPGHAYRILGSVDSVKWEPFSLWLRPATPEGAHVIPPVSGRQLQFFRLEVKP